LHIHEKTFKSGHEQLIQNFFAEKISTKISFHYFSSLFSLLSIVLQAKSFLNEFVNEKGKLDTVLLRNQVSNFFFIKPFASWQKLKLPLKHNHEKPGFLIFINFLITCHLTKDKFNVYYSDDYKIECAFT
jgi:hypothetical protein